MSYPANIASQPKKAGASFRGDGSDRQFQASANGFGNIAHRHAFFRDRVVLCVRFGPFDRQPIEARDVDNIRRRPAIESVSDIGAHALFAKDCDRRGDETLRHRVVNLRKTHHRHIDPVRGDSGGRLLRRRAGMRVGTDGRVVFPGRLTGHGVGDRGPGGHDQRAGRSRQERSRAP